MNHPVMKRIFAVVMMVGIMMSSLVMSSALDLDNLKLDNLVPHGSNPQNPDSNKGSTISDSIDSFKEIFVTTAPDQVVEAFGIADEDYAKTHEYCFAVNTSQNIVIAYQQDAEGVFNKPVKAFVCSAGLAKTPTKTGIFKTSDRYRWRALNGGVWGQYATRITGPYLFHSVPYEKKDPSTLETAEYNKLGSNASAGCVRLSVYDAKWIQNRCPEGTIVYVYEGSGVREPLAKPSAQKIDLTSPNAGWDPTDPSADNPWKA